MFYKVLNRTLVASAFCGVLLANLALNENAAHAQATTSSNVIDLSAGFYPDPQSVDATTVGEVCIRNRSDTPALTINYTAGEGELFFYAASAADTTLAVRGPDGRMQCNDDGHPGVNPGIAIAHPTSGRYEIWVGRYMGNDAQAAARVFVSELGFPERRNGRVKSPPPPADPRTDAAFQASLLVSPAADEAEANRRAQVQAEALLHADHAPAAAAAYRSALQSSPRWAQGHYNLALVAASLNNYAEAITEMRRYLYLDPNAPDARAAQDQIYAWEALLAVSR